MLAEERFTPLPRLHQDPIADWLYGPGAGPQPLDMTQADTTASPMSEPISTF